ncbi:hypothetical protein [Solidesulfovibrio sp.]|uniref:hypothetical protein n=1 Tax=Solidesulfovibrio sp. TaxID=2910990 RepID=UPI0026204B85|nr:hypothetical protein [Solidesulfovibrio sp.]
MTPVSFDPAFALIALSVALFFLLLGWRLGRESAGRPMFDFPLLPAARGDRDACPCPQDGEKSGDARFGDDWP